MSTKRENKLSRYLLMTLDPVHIGTGGYRLGRVDNSIAREPGTRLPKIPGTSLSGVMRKYAAYLYEKSDCASQKKQCGKDECPICYTFGSVSGEEESEQRAHAGAVSIFDAQILFFPVWTMLGPKWVTTKQILERFEMKGTETVPIDAPTDDEHFTSTFPRNEALNFGWLMLEPKTSGEKVTLPTLSDHYNGKECDEYKAMKDHVAIVRDAMFSRIVNDNLEVRTSVAINPETGAAERGALFTYEAIPRATFLMMEVVEDYFEDKFHPVTKKATLIKEENGKKQYQDDSGDPLPEKWETPITVVQTGLKQITLLGVGGMGTRGFGRVKWVKKA